MKETITVNRALLSILILFSAWASPIAAETIVIFGASGKIGGLIVDEAIGRGHDVRGVSRNPDGLAFEAENFSATAGDILDVDSVKSLAEGADAIVISVSGVAEGNRPEDTTHARSATVMVEALGDMEGAPRVIQIGGGSTMGATMESLKASVPPWAQEGTPGYAIYLGHMVALETYRASDIDWTVLAPAWDIMGWTPEGITDATSTLPEYRTSTEAKIEDENGESRIYVRDLARATIDEVENGAFIRQLFTIGY